MRVLLLGGHGMLGTDLLATVPAGHEIVAPPRAVLDITDPRALARAIEDARPEIIINAAAFTAVDRAESDPKAAEAVNATALGDLGRLAAVRGLRVIHFSTDYVFDGQKSIPYLESDSTTPLNVYGATKLAGERALLDACDQALVLRTQWLFGLAGRSFPRLMADRARSGAATRVVDDQMGRPTFTEDLARTTWRLVSLYVHSDRILHVTNEGSTSWYRFARHVFSYFGAESLLTPCTTAEYSTPAPRPARAVLDTSRLQALLGDSLPHWENAVNRFLDRLSQRKSDENDLTP